MTVVSFSAEVTVCEFRESMLPRIKSTRLNNDGFSRSSSFSLWFMSMRDCRLLTAAGERGILPDIAWSGSASRYCKIILTSSGWSRASRIRRKYVSTATDDPPSASEDSNNDGYLQTVNLRCQGRSFHRLTRAAAGIRRGNGRSVYV